MCCLPPTWVGKYTIHDSLSCYQADGQGPHWRAWGLDNMGRECWTTELCMGNPSKIVYQWIFNLKNESIITVWENHSKCLETVVCRLKQCTRFAVKLRNVLFSCKYQSERLVLNIWSDYNARSDLGWESLPQDTFSGRTELVPRGVVHLSGTSRTQIPVAWRSLLLVNVICNTRDTLE